MILKMLAGTKEEQDQLQSAQIYGAVTMMLSGWRGVKATVQGELNTGHGGKDVAQIQDKALLREW